MTYYERNLPHWQPEGKRLFVTWRLYRSLPVAVFEKLRKSNLDEGEQFAAYDRELDSGKYGPLWLTDHRIAGCVVEAIEEMEKDGSYRVGAYVVMPNHVHLLIEPRAEFARIMKRLKGGTAREANRILKRTGESFWQDESFDHWIRDGALERTIRYIEQNPVKAGLARAASEWLWSTANKRRTQTEVCATGAEKHV